MMTRLTATQQALLSMLARYRRDGAPYPPCAMIALELCVGASAVPTTLRRQQVFMGLVTSKGNYTHEM